MLKFTSENSLFSRIFRCFFHRIQQRFQNLSTLFSTDCRIWKFLLNINTFFIFSTSRRIFSTDFSTTCGKLFSIALRVLSYPSEISWTSNDISATIRRHLFFLPCHWDKILFFFQISKQFHLFSVLYFRHFIFLHEFSTECGKACGKLIWTNIKISLTSKKNFEKLPFLDNE